MAAAQSNDVEYPTPVREATITGRIPPRDLGDARLTQHFYTFTGTTGDIMIRLEGANLEGDVDLFIANGLRPLLKIGLYAAGTTTTTTKTAYLKRRETLLLRVEARTPDDREGTYNISFSGAFEVYGGPERTPPPVIASAAPAPSANPSGVRVNSAGARLDPPPPPKPKPTPAVVAVVPKPPKPPARPRPATAKPTPSSTPAPPTVIAENSDAGNAPPAPPARPKRSTRPTKNPPPAVAATPRPAKKPSAPPVAPPAANVESTAPEVVAATPAPAKPKPPVKAKPAPKPPKPAPPVIQTQVVLELKDGTTITREAVRRVMVDKSELVIITATGQLERYALADVAKLSVAPTIVGNDER